MGNAPPQAQKVSEISRAESAGSMSWWHHVSLCIIQPCWPCWTKTVVLPQPSVPALSSGMLTPPAMDIILLSPPEQTVCIAQLKPQHPELALLRLSQMSLDSCSSHLSPLGAWDNRFSRLQLRHHRLLPLGAQESHSSCPQLPYHHLSLLGARKSHSSNPHLPRCCLFLQQNLLLPCH